MTAAPSAAPVIVGRAEIAPGHPPALAEGAQDCDGLLGGSADSTTLVRLAHCAAPPGSRRVMLAHVETTPETLRGAIDAVLATRLIIGALSSLENNRVYLTRQHEGGLDLKDVVDQWIAGARQPRSGSPNAPSKPAPSRQSRRRLISSTDFALSGSRTRAANFVCSAAWACFLSWWGDAGRLSRFGEIPNGAAVTHCLRGRCPPSELLVQDRALLVGRGATTDRGSVVRRRSGKGHPRRNWPVTNRRDV